MADPLNQKLINAIHFVISEANSYNLNIGRTLIAKIIVFSEVLHYNFYGERLTNAKIVKAPFGPIPDRYADYLSALENLEKIRVDHLGYRSLVEGDSSGFSTKEKGTMAATTKFLGANFTARKLSESTHESIVWQVAEMGEELPVAGLFSSRILEFDSEAMERIREALAEVEFLPGMENSYE